MAPYDDPYTIAGQGTIGTEILRQLTTAQLEKLHAIFVPVGGGGLIAGIAAYVKMLRPDIKIIGVECSGVPDIPSYIDFCLPQLSYHDRLNGMRWVPAVVKSMAALHPGCHAEEESAVQEQMQWRSHWRVATVCGCQRRTPLQTALL